MVCQGKPYTTQIILYCLARGIWLIGPWQLTTCLHTLCVIVINKARTFWAWASGCEQLFLAWLHYLYILPLKYGAIKAT